MAQQTINLLQVLVLLLIAYLTVRLVLSLFRGTSSTYPAATGDGTRQRPAHNGSRVNPAHVEQVVQMFPQLNRRDIMWDLQRNGGSVQATTERVLTGRGLDVPPPSFRPPLPQTSPSSQSAQAKPKNPAHADLITRYNLASKVSTAEPAPSDKTPTKRSGWSSNKVDRQANFQRRRDEMILAARRKMEEKDRSAGPS